MEKLERYQRHLAGMLEQFQEFCQQNQLEFFLVGGTAKDSAFSRISSQ